MDGINGELLRLARTKVAKAASIEPNSKLSFVDPTTATGAAGPGAAAAAPVAGAMPPMPGMGPDPAAAGGGEAAVGMPPEEGAAAEGGGVTAAEVEQIVSRLLASQGGGAGGGNGEGNAKPKVDVNTEIYHIKKLLTRMASELGIQIDPQMLQGDPADDPAVPNTEAAKDPESAAASMMGQSAINPIEPMQGASPALAAAGGGGGETAKAADASWENGRPYESPDFEPQSTWVATTSKAAAIASLLRNAKAAKQNAS